METTAKAPSKHIGRKISRIRELRGMKQDALAHELNISQQAVSKIEQSETVETEMLERIAKVLGVSPQAIENFNEEAIFYNIQNNYEGANSGAESVSVTNYQCQFNPIDKIVELYERLVQSEKEKVELLKENKK